MRARTSASSATGEASIDLSGWKSASRAVRERVVARQQRGAPDVPGEHARPLDGGHVPLEGPGDGRLQVALAQADAQLAAQDGHDGPRAERVGARQQRREEGPLGRGTPGRGEGLVRRGHLAQAERGSRGRGAGGAGREELPDRDAQVRGAIVGRPHGRPRPPR